MPITGTSTLLQAHPPLCPASVLGPSWVFHLGFSLNIEATGSQVPCPSQDRTRATLMPDATLAVSGSPPALIPEQRLLPGFDVVPMLSTLRRWFSRVRLPDPHLTRSRRAFSLTLTTGALDPSRSRWFGACLRRPAPRGLPSSRTDIAWRTVIRIVDDVSVEPLFVPQELPAHDEPTHIDVSEQRRQRRPLRAPPVLVL